MYIYRNHTKHCKTTKELWNATQMWVHYSNSACLSCVFITILHTSPHFRCKWLYVALFCNPTLQMKNVQNRMSLKDKFAQRWECCLYLLTLQFNIFWNFTGKTALQHSASQQPKSIRTCLKLTKKTQIKIKIAQFKIIRHNPSLQTLQDAKLIWKLICILLRKSQNLSL